MSIRSQAAWLLFLSLVRGVSLHGAETPFPGENAYGALQAQALRQGYGDIARGVGVLLSYRRGLEACSRDHGSGSSRAFASFLDSIVGSVHAQLKTNSIRRSFRESVADYVTQCIALAEVYVREKARRYNGDPSRLDASDETLVLTGRRLQERVARIARVPAPSLPSAMARWRSADWPAYSTDPRYGWAAVALLRLDPEREPYCRPSVDSV